MSKTNFFKAAESLINIVTSPSMQKFLCGTYSDGTPRSLPDALNDETKSPKQRQKKKKKSKKKKKKNNIFIDL